MRSEQKQKIQGIVTAAVLIAVPFLLNACSGNPLNGEPLRLWKTNEGSTPPPAAKPAGKSQPVVKPTNTPPAANACKAGIPQLNGKLDSNDKDLGDLEKRIAELEATQPQESDLYDQIRDYNEKMQLKLEPKALRRLQKRIVALSGAQATSTSAKAKTPAPTANPAPTAAPAPGAPYRLHASIVGLIAYEAAVAFALDQDNKLELNAAGAASFADQLAIRGFQPTTPGENDLSVVVFSKAYKLAISSDGLGYSSTAARKFMDDLFTLPNGNLRALTWVSNYNSEHVHSRYSPADAIADANEALGYKPSPSDPASGFCGYTPVPVVTPTPVPAQPSR